MKTTLASFVLFAFSLPFSSDAQVIKMGYAQAAPHLYTDSGKFLGCGLSINLLEESIAGTRGLFVYTIMVKNGVKHAIIKTQYFDATEKPKVSAVPVSLHSSWVRFGTSDPIVPLASGSGDDFSKLELVDFGSAMDMAKTISIQKTLMQAGIQRSSDSNEYVVSARVNISEKDVHSFLTCVLEYKQKLNEAEPR